jgi:hypothetical protein
MLGSLKTGKSVFAIKAFVEDGLLLYLGVCVSESGHQTFLQQLVSRLPRTNRDIPCEFRYESGDPNFRGQKRQESSSALPTLNLVIF